MTFQRRFIMKRLSMLLAIILLAGCASTVGTSGASGTSEGMRGWGTTDQMYINRHDNPADTYFGG